MTDHKAEAEHVSVSEVRAMSEPTEAEWLEGHDPGTLRGRFEEMTSSDRLSEIRKRLDASPFVDDAWDEDMRWLIEQYERLTDDNEFLRLTVREQSTVQQRHETGMDVRRDALAVEVTALRSKLTEVRAYAEDRAFHAKGHLNTVNSGRIATDLLTILDRESDRDE